MEHSPSAPKSLSVGSYDVGGGGGGGVSEAPAFGGSEAAAFFFFGPDADEDAEDRLALLFLACADAHAARCLHELVLLLAKRSATAAALAATA